MTTAPMPDLPLRTLRCGCVRYLDSTGTWTDFPCREHVSAGPPRFVKSLSVLQPWSDVILSRAKLVENRDWYDVHRGLFLIHAGKGWDSTEPSALVEGEELSDDYIDWACELGGWPTTDYPAAYERRGGLLGIADMIGCVREGNVPKAQTNWANGPWCFLMAPTALVFTEPIPYRGDRRFFDVPVEAVTAAMRTAVPWEQLGPPPRFAAPVPAPRPPRPQREPEPSAQGTLF